MDYIYIHIMSLCCSFPKKSCAATSDCTRGRSCGSGQKRMAWGTRRGRLRTWPLKQGARPIWVFPTIGVPQNGWFIMENLIEMDDLGVALFS